ncbi:MAG TPA: zf-HC2 domain-containing protein [Vicinamibacterales bacterium]|jgi:hypothetical protein
MTDGFSCADKETLVSYVYGECDAATRDQVDAHLAVCPECTDEIRGFGLVRTTLAEWTPPARAVGFRLVRDEAIEAAPASAHVLRPPRWWQTSMPLFARAAAAVLLVAGGAALANVEVRYDKDGLVVRTGWQHPGGPVAGVSPVAASGGVEQAARLPGEATSAGWQTELTALEQRLRNEMRVQIASTRPASSPSMVRAANAGFDEKQFMTRVRALLDESERRQQNEMAYRLSLVAGDQMQRRNEMMMRVQQGIGLDSSRVRPKTTLFDVSLKKQPE